MSTKPADHRRDGSFRPGNQAASKGGFERRLALWHTTAQAQAGLTWVEKNDGQHFIVSSYKGRVDLWPSTGQWKLWNGRRGWGLKILLLVLKDLGALPQAPAVPPPPAAGPPGPLG
jgi:hypothetical protein